MSEFNVTIEVARVSMQALVSRDAFELLNTPEPLDYDPAQPCHLTLDLPILQIPDPLVQQDGFVAAKILSGLRTQMKELWLMFGTATRQNGKRCYIVLQGNKIPEQLAVVDWEIVSWTKEKLHQF